MNTLNVILSNLDGKIIPLGYEGENLYTRVRINCAEVFSESPDAVVSMVVRPPVGDMYPVAVDKSGVMVVWDITDSVLSSSGQGQVQLTFTDDETIRKSVVFGISINSSLVASGEAPEPVQEWIDSANETAHQIAHDAAMEAAEEVIESIPEDYTQLSDDVSDLKSAIAHKADCVYPTASGSIASFPDGADGMEVKSLSVAIDPVQDLHGYDAPWPPAGNKNLFDKDGNLTNGQFWNASTNTYGTNGDYKLTDYIPVSGSNVVVSGSNAGYAGGSVGMGCFDANKDFVRSSAAKTMDITGAAYVRLSVPIADINTFMLEYGTTASGTYTPYSNICPITGHSSVTVTRTGVNVWDEEWRNGYYSNSGVFSANANYVANKNPVPVFSNTSYRFLIDPAPQAQVGRDVFYYNRNGDFISKASYYSDDVITTPSDCYFINFNFCSAYGATYKNDVGINYPATDTAYHAHSIQSIQIPLGQTVYGGTLDAVAGTLTVDWTKVDLKQVDFDTVGDRPASVGGGKFFMGNLSTPLVKMDAGVFSSGELYSHGQAGDAYYMAGNRCAAYQTQNKTYFRCGFADPNYLTTLEAFNTWKQAQSVFEIAFPLDTPVIVDLTAQELSTLLGQNNIFADTGNVSVDYPADTKMYIDNAITQAIANALNA